MTIGQPVACILSGLAIGVLVEGVARALRIWTYRTPGYLAINILVMFGLVEGYGVGWVVGGRHAMGGIFPVLFMVGAVIGIAVEGLNEFWLHAWSWSERPFIGIVRSIDKAAFTGFAWGFAPLFTVLMASAIMAAQVNV